MNLNEVDRNIQIKELREIKESLYDNELLIKKKLIDSKIKKSNIKK